ncbi:TetR/AcrR family transcriptional regulator [Mycolicibacterium cosmeticum]|uniref:Transcriptional regulator n=1 Tax=Mycolicibacterium cosmeticum TaxID=258533 RepID=W9AMS1_MYCCO|nr:TetR/AcrR family transcriptional regulator [Mycolicibacterium cosmeticum]CDO06773.1 transcriptional regulator [Mycolicibacterium cosmeticum]
MPPECSLDEERGRIIDATYECLLEPHEGPVPVAAILARAGVSSRAFYRHFESKDELFLAMLQNLTAALSGWLDDIARGPGTPAEQLRAWIGQMFALATEPLVSSYLAVMESDEMRSAKGYPYVRELARTDRERSLAEILRRGVQDGSFPLAEPEVDAVAINALVSRQLTVPVPVDPASVDVAERRVLGFAMRALGAGKL